MRLNKNKMEGLEYDYVLPFSRRSEKTIPQSAWAYEMFLIKLADELEKDNLLKYLVGFINSSTIIKGDKR